MVKDVIFNAMEIKCIVLFLFILYYSKVVFCSFFLIKAYTNHKLVLHVPLVSI